MLPNFLKFFSLLLFLYEFSYFINFIKNYKQLATLSKQNFLQFVFGLTQIFNYILYLSIQLTSKF